MAMVNEDRWQRLGRLVKERRAELGETQDQAVARGRTIKIATWRKIEAGISANYTTNVVAGLERGLMWRHGSVADVLNGEQPTIDETAERLRRRPGDALIADPGPPPPPRYPTPPVRADTPDALRRAFEELDHWFEELVEKVAALSWQSKDLVMAYVDELLGDEAQAWLGHRLSEAYEPPPDEPQELRDAKEELALAAAGELELDAATKATLEQVVRDTLDESE